MHECANCSTFSSWNPATANKFFVFYNLHIETLKKVLFSFFQKLHSLFWKEYFSGDDYDDGLYLDITITLCRRGNFFDAWIRSNHTILYLHIQWTINQ